MFRSLLWKSVFGTSVSKKNSQSLRRARPHHRSKLAVEVLENRVTPAVNLLQSGGTLNITSDSASDTITITELDSQRQYEVVANTTDGTGTEQRQTFSNITAINVQTGDGDDVVTFDAESDQNSTGLSGGFTVNGRGGALTVNIEANVTIRGVTTITTAGNGLLTVDVSGVDENGGFEGPGATGNPSTRLNGITVRNTSAAGDSTIIIGPEVRISGLVSLDLADGDDNVTITEAQIIQRVRVVADAGVNTFSVTDSSITGGLDYLARDDQADETGTAIGDDVAITGSNIGGAVTIDLRGSDQSASVAVTDSSVRTLTIIGGNQAEEVTLDGINVRGNVTIDARGGTGDGTTGTEALVVDILGSTRVTGSVSVSVERNLDFSLAGDTRVTGSVALSARGSGDSTVSIGGVAIEDDPTTFDVDETAEASGATIGGSVTFTGGSGLDTIDIANSLIRGNVTLNLGGNSGISDNGDQASSITLSNAFIRGNLTQGGVSNGTIDVTVTDNSWVVGSVVLGVSAAAEITVLIEDNSPIGGSLTVTGGSGEDSLTIDGGEGVITIGGAVALNLGDGTSTVILTEVQIDNSFRLTTVGTNSENTTDVNAVTLDLNNVSVGGILSVNLGQGFDTLTFQGLTVEGTTTVSTGRGEDTITILDSDFLGNVNLDTGDGNDTVNLESGEGTTGGFDLNTLDTIFYGGFILRTGNGDDTVDLGSDAQNRVVFYGSAEFQGGGNGGDTINDDFADFLGSDPVFGGFSERQ